MIPLIVIAFLFLYDGFRSMLLYNSLTRKKEEFKPLSHKAVKMYVCGITPYDTTHLGHAFVYVTTDALIRYLMSRGYHVDYTQNVTDIDDDILKRAAEEKKDWQKLGDFWTKKFLNDMKALNVLPPTHYVKATNSIESIINITQKLVEKGHAYEKKGTVYFEVAKYRDYGKLSKLSEKQMQLLLKERGGDPKDPSKRAPLDFILWQKTKKNEPSWKSPWGKGRPGWHVECSSMVYDYLGDQIDIHGGGHDLIYPHHESEIAQSESFTGKKPFAKYWLHTAMLQYEGEKMSKSLGNLIMVSDLLKQYSPDSIRYVLLSHHYRAPWDFQQDELEEAEQIMRAVKQLVSRFKKVSMDNKNTIARKFIKAMEDDLNIPLALQTLISVAKKIKDGKSKKGSDILVLKACLETLGFRL